MRIGIFTECYHPTLNGVVVSIDTFRKDMEQRGHEYFIFAPETKGFRDLNPHHVFRFPAIAWPQKDYPIAFPALAPSQKAHIRDLNLDIIHSQHLFSMGKLGLKMARVLDIPIVYTYHTLIAEYTHYVPLLSGLAKGVIIGMSRRYCNACDQIVTPSPSMKKILRSYGVTTPIEALPTGVDLGEFQDPFTREELASKWHIPQNKKLLLYVSRIAKEKNLDFLFEAIEHLRQKRQDFHLLMVGGGPELRYYQQKVTQGLLKPFVTFAGKKEKKEANRFFGAADIFVFPSVTETQGIVITEAMASGIPAVAVGIMGPSDIISDGQDGFLVPLNAETFSSKIAELLSNDDLRTNMGRKARQNAEEYSTSNMALAMEKLYERTISHST